MILKYLIRKHFLSSGAGNSIIRNTNNNFRNSSAAFFEAPSLPYTALVKTMKMFLIKNSSQLLKTKFANVLHAH